VTLRDEDLSEIAVDVRTNQKKPLLFALGKGDRKTTGDLTRAWVLTIEGSASDSCWHSPRWACR
jgi:hypothetical protein